VKLKTPISCFRPASRNKTIYEPCAGSHGRRSRAILSIGFFFPIASLFNLRDLSFERGVFVKALLLPSGITLPPTPLFALPISIPFFTSSFARCASFEIYERGGLKREASLGTKAKLRRPSRRPRAEIEKNRNYTRRERKPARSRHVPTRFRSTTLNPLTLWPHDPPSSTLLRPSADVMGDPPGRSRDSRIRGSYAIGVREPR